MILAHVVYLRSMAHYERTGLGDPTMIYVEDDQMMSAVAGMCRESYKRPDTVEWRDHDTVYLRWEYDAAEGHGPIVMPKNGVKFAHG